MKVIRGFQRARRALSRKTGGDVVKVSPALRESLKGLFGTGNPELAVKKIIREVKKHGDTALRDLILKIDGFNMKSIEVSKEDIDCTRARLDSKLLKALELAAERVRDFHLAQKDSIYHEVSRNGLQQLIRPLQRVGVYVPGGMAAYPSTVLMTAIPARVAGVHEVVMVTPPGRKGIPLAILAAASIAGVDRVFSVGGAQAVAALAYGTETIPAVDKICGPGNIFVMLAKKAVFGAVAIDGLQGPSEVLIIADGKADAGYCAADILAQAEHDPLAMSVLVTTSPRLAYEVNREVGKQLTQLSRQAIARESLDRGVIAVVDTLEEAIELCNEYAPEHLCLIMENAASYIAKIRNAGCIITGREATVVLGDYVAGPSHALPTGGTARFGSPLNVADFIKFISVINTEKLDIKRLGEAASVIARIEGLDAHARAIESRIKDG